MPFALELGGAGNGETTFSGKLSRKAPIVINPLCRQASALFPATSSFWFGKAVPKEILFSTRFY